MPGITGIISKIPRGEGEKDLHQMVDCMMHEPFYTSGTYINKQLNLYAGWVSHQNSFSDCMPVFNENKDLVLLFSGENFADQEVLDRLKKRGHEFNRSDASYLIHLYEDDEEKFLQNLNGWFSGILIDLRKGKIILFNDRYGMQRIFYHEKKDTIYFSSEIKSLLKVCPDLRNTDNQGLGELFACGFVLENRTLFSNVFSLPGGSAWTYHNGCSAKKSYYFKPSTWENQPVLEKEVFYKKLRETFHNILPRYFNSKDLIGMSLTGGLDSRMILACIDIPPGKLPFYTFGGMYRDCYDVKVSRKVADAYHQSHNVLLLGKEFLSDFPNHAEKSIYVTDGCHDVCGSYSIYLNSLARKIAPIRMTGTFGSEILRGVSGFKASLPDKKLFHPDFYEHLIKAGKTVDNNNKGHRLTFSLFKEAPWLKNNIILAEQSQLTYRTPFMDNDLVSLTYQAPTYFLTNNELSLRLIKDGHNPALFNIMTDRGFGGRKNFPQCIQLFYYVVFKAEWYHNTGMPHWMSKLDSTVAPLQLEKLILGRNKFDHFRKWFQSELSDYVREILLDKRTTDRPFLNGKFLEKMVNGHIKRDRNYLREINKTLTVELIHRLLIEDI